MSSQNCLPRRQRRYIYAHLSDNHQVRPPVRHARAVKRTLLNTCDARVRNGLGELLAHAFARLNGLELRDGGALPISMCEERAGEDTCAGTESIMYAFV